MARIRDTYVKASTGWNVIDPKTGVEFRSNSYRNLRGQVITHRRSNQLPEDDVDQMIHDQICSREPDAYCQEWPTHLVGHSSVSEPSVFDMLANFTKSVAYWAGQGFPTVSKELFEHRMSTCQACPHYDAEAFWQRGKCRKCGCCTQIKPWLGTNKCPDGRW